MEFVTKVCWQGRQSSRQSLTTELKVCGKSVFFSVRCSICIFILDIIVLSSTKQNILNYSWKGYDYGIKLLCERENNLLGLISFNVYHISRQLLYTYIVKFVLVLNMFELFGTGLKQSGINQSKVSLQMDLVSPSNM